MNPIDISRKKVFAPSVTFRIPKHSSENHVISSTEDLTEDIMLEKR